MGFLKNVRHEKFAQHLAKGMSADAAYEKAGYSANRGNATRLKANERLQARVAELQKKTEQVAVLTRADVLRELADNAVEAKKLGQLSARNQALSLYGKELGMFVDRRLLGVTRIGDMNEEELLEFLGESEGASPSASDPPAGNA